MTHPRRVLVVGPAWIGDMVMAQSLFMLLRQRLPHARIDVLAPALTASLTVRMPEVDRAWVMPIGHGEFALGARRGLARSLRAAGYDQAIVMQRSLKAALIPWLARIAQRTGYRGELRYGLINDARPLDIQRYPRKVEHYALLGLAKPRDTLTDPPMPRLTRNTANQRRLVATLGLDLERPVAGFAPGAAFGGAKQWPATHYARLASELDQRGIACWIFGSAADRAIADAMLAAAPGHAVDLCQRTALTDVADLAALTQCFIGNDTGIMHLAAATAPYVIGVYGSTDPDYAPPLAAQSRRFWLGLACAPCRARVCPLGHTACMRDIPVADILRACLEPQATDMASLHYASATPPGWLAARPA